MKITKATPEMTEYLTAMGIPGLLPIELDDQALTKEHEHAKQQHPEETPEYQWARAVARVAYQKYQSRGKESFQHPYFAKIIRTIHIYGISILIILGILLIFAVAAHAQIDVIRLQDDGVPQGTFAAPFTINCAVNVSCSKSGSTMLISASGGAGTGCIPPGVAGDILTDDGVGGCTTELSKVPVTLGGTNLTTLTAHSLYVGNGTSAPVAVANGTSGQVLIAQTGADPIFTDPLVSGAAAHDAPGAAINPVAMGCYANAAAPADVSNDVDITRDWCLRNGSQVINIAAGGALIPGDATNGLKVQITTAPTITVTGALTDTQLRASAVPVSGAFFQSTQPVSIASGASVSGAIVDLTNSQVSGGGTTAPTKVLMIGGKTNDGTAQYDILPEGAAGRSVIIEGFAGGTAVPVSLATVAVTQSSNPWVTSCTAANCVNEIADGSANKLTSNSNTYTAKFGLDANILGLDGALMSATNTLFDQITDGAAAMGVMANFGVSPGGVKSLNVNASIFSGTTALGAPNTFGTTAPTGNALGVNAACFNGTTLCINDGTAGAAGIGGHFADNGVAAATNRIPTLPCIYQTSYLNGTAATQGRNGALSCGTDGLLMTGSLPALRPASYHASASFAGSSTTLAAHLIGNATNMVLVTKVMFSCTQTTAGNVTVTVNKTSAASSGGTAATMTAIPDDSVYSAASGSAQSFTGTGPTAGTPVGQIDAYKLGCMATGTATPNDIYILNLRQKPIVLRAAGQTLEIGVGAATVGGNYTTTFEWEEVPIITE